MNIKPLADRVLIEPKESETTTASGIIIPDSAKEKPLQGTVVAVGEGKPNQPLTVKVGDEVIYGKYAVTTDLRFEQKNYLLMKEDEILAII